MKHFIMAASLVFTFTASVFANASICSLQSFDGHYLTAVGGGGRVTDVIHSDANVARAWEKFRFVEVRAPGMPLRYAIQTMTGNYFTIVGGGGRVTDVIHSNATRIGAWEIVRLVSLGHSIYAIQTATGNFLTAQDSGGRVTDVIHSNATRIGTWERFRLYCHY
jgi:hypothetical protein